MNKVRREKIHEFIEKQELVSMHQLNDLFPSVSSMTIHRDLNHLQDAGFITKIRGGAKIVKNGRNEPIFSVREIYKTKEKEIIARKIIPLLKDAKSVYLDPGTTMMTLAKMFPDIVCTIITSGPNIALELVGHQSLTINLCGGVLNKSNLALSGPATEAGLSDINIDTAFIVTSGFSEETGFTCGLQSEGDLKQLVTKRARRTFMILDSSKIGKILPYTFARLDSFTTIITDKDPSELPDTFTALAKKSKITLI